jgi:hypothetical protein
MHEAVNDVARNAGGNQSRGWLRRVRPWLLTHEVIGALIMLGGFIMLAWLRPLEVMPSGTWRVFDVPPEFQHPTVEFPSQADPEDAE